MSRAVAGVTTPSALGCKKGRPQKGTLQRQNGAARAHRPHTPLSRPAKASRSGNSVRRKCGYAAACSLLPQAAQPSAAARGGRSTYVTMMCGSQPCAALLCQQGWATGAGAQRRAPSPKKGAPRKAHTLKHVCLLDAGRSPPRAARAKSHPRHTRRLDQCKHSGRRAVRGIKCTPLRERGHRQQAAGRPPGGGSQPVGKAGTAAVPRRAPQASAQPSSSPRASPRPTAHESLPAAPPSWGRPQASAEPRRWQAGSAGSHGRSPETPDLRAHGRPGSAATWATAGRSRAATWARRPHAARPHRPSRRRQRPGPVRRRARTRTGARAG